MQRPFPWFWIGLAALLLLLPGPSGRFLLDVLGGLTLTLLLLPLLAAGAGLLGWQLLRRNLRTCLACGTTSFGGSVCPACGTPREGPTSERSGVFWSEQIAADDASDDVSNVTINVEVVDVDAETKNSPN
jgi:ribosomal protein L32